MEDGTPLEQIADILGHQSGVWRELTLAETLQVSDLRG
jgi:hypothetical protein